MEVVGVAEDFHFLSLHNPVTPMMLRLYPEDVSGWNVSVKISGQEIPATIAFIENKFKEFFPNEIFAYRFLDEDFERMYQEERKSGKVILYLAVLAIFIACLGLFGLASFATKQRTKEIGIRKVVGRLSEQHHLAPQFPISQAHFVGLCAGLAACLLHHVSLAAKFPVPDSPPGLGVRLGWSGCSFVALLTVSFQSIKAATASPSDSLRNE